jgi:hypothetical protein
MDDPNLYTNRSGFAGTIAGLTYVTAWGGLAHELYGATAMGMLHNVLIGPFAYGPVPPILAGLSAIAIGVGLYKGMYLPAEKHKRGIKLYKDHKTVAQAMKPAKEKAGIRIHPEIQISEEQECKHILLLGGSGSGKTSILWPIINQVIERGDKAIILSFKNDFQEKAKFDFTLLAPWDARSIKWRLGYDIQTRLQAESLANTLIPLPKEDKIWAQGAQGLLTAIIADLQTSKGTKWGYPELAYAVANAMSDYNKLVEIVLREKLEAKAYLMGQDSKTTASFLAQIASGLTGVINIGVGEYENARLQENVAEWSVRAWLEGKTPSAAIIGFKPSAEQLSQAWASSIVEQVVSQILDMPDCDPSNEGRRVWLFLDEVPRFGKIPSITTALETIRSKGVRMVLGAQSISQIETTYDKATSTIWAGQINIKIIANLAAPLDQKWASDLLGEREIERYQKQTSSSMNGPASISGGYQHHKEHVLMPSQFGSELYVIPQVGPMALVQSTRHAAILTFPFPPIAHQREAEVAATWTKAGYKRPNWGAVPPKIDIPATTVTTQETKQSTEATEATVPPQQNLASKVAPAPVKPAVGKEGAVATEVVHEAMGQMLDTITPGISAIMELMGMTMDQAGQGSPVATTKIDQTPQPVAQENTQEESEEERENG